MTMNNDTEHQTAQIDFSMSKDFMVLVPLFGTALAITYDVGYFSGINLDLFTFFSLSEHTVFALQVFPFALIAASAIGLLIFYIRPFAKAAEVEFRRNTSQNTKRFLVLLISLCIVVCTFIITFKEYPTPAMIGGAFAGILIVVSYFTNDLFVRAVLICLIATIYTFGFGYGLATIDLQPSKYSSLPSTSIETKENGAIDARLIRSGDRGVLFVDKRNGQVTLLRWDEIKQISTVQAQ